METTKNSQARPVLKWAGGKTQLLDELLLRAPKAYGKYIEPFFGGGALFFALKPENAVIADSNPELINMYQQIAINVDEVIDKLKRYHNSQEEFYAVREQNWMNLSKSEAAARMIYLNRTCFNGLYRVNRQGQFNVPFGKYKNPKICDETNLRQASIALQGVEIVCGDYLSVLDHYAKAGDFIFLDPPYLPISENADFKRYTKEQFYLKDHVELADMVHKLHDRGCYILLTNSNHPLVHELYAPYKIDIVSTKRHISCHGDTRKGEDAIVTIPPSKAPRISSKLNLPKQVSLYPPTRFMGSKRKLLSEIWSVASQFQSKKIIDLFSGSGIVGYMFKAQGKAVVSNDYMAMSSVFAKAMIENSHTVLLEDEAQNLLLKQRESDYFVSKTFNGLYYSDKENDLIDTLRTNILFLKDEYKRAIALSALIRACMKKRPRGIFTYTGNRYNDGRMDLQKTLEQQFLEAVNVINCAIFDNGQTNQSVWGDALSLEVNDADLVYIDPPYYTPLSDNEYVRRYHFVEGLARNWEGVEIQQHTQTKKFRSYPTPFSTKDGAAAAFNSIFNRYANCVLIVSYSSNSLPSQQDMIALMSKYKKHVEVVPIDYTYSFGNQSVVKSSRNKVQEYLFVGF